VSNSFCVNSGVAVKMPTSNRLMRKVAVIGEEKIKSHEEF
jgi:hypothetical protein